MADKAWVKNRLVGKAPAINGSSSNMADKA
jgi:hypothetical protein